MFDFCVPTRRTKVPHHPDWIHEVKYDGYRLMVHRDGDRVRLITRNGYDWTRRYPWIVEAARRNRIKQFVIDGEAVILGLDGISDFAALHSGKHGDEVQLYAFDVLTMDGDDLRGLPLSMRKASLARLLRGQSDGMFIAPFEQGEIGPDLPCPQIAGFAEKCRTSLRPARALELVARGSGGLAVARRLHDAAMGRGNFHGRIDAETRHSPDASRRVAIRRPRGSQSQ